MKTRLSDRQARHGWLAGITLALLGMSSAQAGALDDFVRLQVGSFTSEAQAKQDARYDAITWHIAEADGTISARRYTLPEAPRFVGAWQEPAKFADLKPADLAELHGCDAVITRAGAGRFEASTLGVRCRNSYKGASYAISQSVLTADEMVNWDRGFDANGNLAWGPAAGGYRFRRVGEAGACVQPVRMLVYGEIRDRKAFGAYVRAIAEAGLYAKTGGYYEAMSPALEVFEGTPPPERGVVIARFPCLEAARQFWHSPEYAEIRKLREGIAEFEVLVLPVPPIPK